jgi:hypothetical protein
MSERRAHVLCTQIAPAARLQFAFETLWQGTQSNSGKPGMCKIAISMNTCFLQSWQTSWAESSSTIHSCLQVSGTQPDVARVLRVLLLRALAGWHLTCCLKALLRAHTAYPVFLWHLPVTCHVMLWRHML